MLSLGTYSLQEALSRAPITLRTILVSVCSCGTQHLSCCPMFCCKVFRYRLGNSMALVGNCQRSEWETQPTKQAGSNISSSRPRWTPGGIGIRQANKKDWKGSGAAGGRGLLSTRICRIKGPDSDKKLRWVPMSVPFLRAFFLWTVPPALTSEQWQWKELSKNMADIN